MGWLVHGAFQEKWGLGSRVSGSTSFGVSKLNVERCVLDQAGIVVGWNLSSIVVFGWCCEVRGDTSGPSAAVQWTRCCVCVK